MPSAQGIQKPSQTKQPQRAFLARHSKRKTLPAPSVPCRVPYLYVPLPKGYIRLLTIKSSKKKASTYHLATYKQSCAPKYDAVSYCWGEDLTSTVINCDGSDLCIRKSLSVALSYLAERPKSGRPLWIDAICLNQEDNEEKAIHVPLMHEIYKNATTTVVWLGEPDENTDMALEFIAEVILHLKHKRDPKDIDEIKHEREWKAIREYLHRPWFSRLWALQEVLLSEAIEILCSGKKTRVLTWQTLEKFLDFMRTADLAWCMIDFSSVNLKRLLGLVYVKNTRPYLEKNGKLSFLVLLDLMENRSCHEPVDKIWALLGLLPYPLVVEIQAKNVIDYSDSGKRDYWKSYLAFMKVLYAWDVFEFDRTMHWTMQYPRHALLPSWCPDFNMNEVSLNSMGVSKNFRAGFTNREEADVPTFTAQLDLVSNALSMDGFCVDEVKCVTCVCPETVWGLSPESRLQYEEQWAAEFFEECEQLVQKCLGKSQEVIEALGEVLLASDQKRDGAYSGNFANCYLCLLENGRSYLTTYTSCPHEQRGMHQDYLVGAALTCAGHKLFATSNGRIGLGPATLEVGDKICVFAGREMLYALREGTEDENLKRGQKFQGEQGGCTQETFSLIGEAYVRGLMYGEAFTADSRGPESKLVIV
jgi:hypothetical protein